MANATPDDKQRIRSGGDRVVIGLFLLLLTLPLLDRWLDLDRAPALVENRALAALPPRPQTWTWAELAGFTSAFDAYWQDHFGFRRRLIRSYAIARYALRTSVSPRVLVGEGGSLFYTGEQAIPAFRGLLPLPSATLRRWLGELEARRRFLERRGIRYLFVIAPNKESVLPEQMPARFTRVSPTPLDQLLWYLAINAPKLEVLDLRAPLIAAKTRGPVFFRTDTHWNDHGSYVAYAALMERLRPWHATLAPRPFASFQPRRGSPVSGDLAGMLGLTDVLIEPLDELVPQPPARAKEVKADDLPRPIESRRMRLMLGPPELPRAIVLHDSFFLAPDERGDPAKPARTDPFMPRNSAFRLSELLAENFSRTILSWQHSMDVGMIEREKPAFLIQEIVERSIPAGPIGATPDR